MAVPQRGRLILLTLSPYVWTVVPEGMIEALAKRAGLASAPRREREEKTMLDRCRARSSRLVGLVAVLALFSLTPPTPARAQATVFNQNEDISLQSLFPLNVI